MELLRSLGDLVLVRLVYGVLMPVFGRLFGLLRGHFQKLTGVKTPGLTAYRQ